MSEKNQQALFEAWYGQSRPDFLGIEQFSWDDSYAAWLAGQRLSEPHWMINPSISKPDAVFRQYEEGKAAQSQPAPPVPADVQEIMRLMNPYVRACAGFDASIDELDDAKAEITEAFKPLQSALTALVAENHRLKFELDGVRAMRGPLNPDEVQAVVDLLKPDHDGSYFEPECPACTAYQKLTSPTHGIEPEQGDNHG